MTKSHMLVLIFNLEPENVLVNTKIKFICTHEETSESRHLTLTIPAHIVYPNQPDYTHADQGFCKQISPIVVPKHMGQG